MISASQVSFLQTKIAMLEYALFTVESDAILKLPSSIVKALLVDEIGQVWFQVSKPSQRLNEFPDAFPAKMNFFKKGQDFYLHVTGKAVIVGEPEEHHQLMDILEKMVATQRSDMTFVKFIPKEIFSRPITSHTKSGHSISFKVSYEPPSAFFKTLQYIVKDVIPVFQPH